MVAPAPLDDEGKITDHGNMGPQMAQTYANAKILLARYGATLDNVVEEVLYVTDMDAFFECLDIRAEYFGPGWPTSTTFEISRLAHPDMMIEIDCIAVVGN